MGRVDIMSHTVGQLLLLRIADLSTPMWPRCACEIYHWTRKVESR